MRLVPCQRRLPPSSSDIQSSGFTLPFWIFLVSWSAEFSERVSFRVNNPNPMMPRVVESSHHHRNRESFPKDDHISGVVKIQTRKEGSGRLSQTETNAQSASFNGTDGAEHYTGTPVLPNQQLKLTVGVSCSTGWCNSNKKRTSFYRRLARRCTDSEIFTCTLPQVSRQSLGSNTGEVLIKESSRVTSCITLVLNKAFGSKHRRFLSPSR